MTTRHVFLAYMTAVGIAAGAVIVAAPHVTAFWLKPYFWVLIAVGVFDAALFLISRAAPTAMLAMDARMLGFVIGAVLMVAIPTVAGTAASFF
jgi:uncharacterized membrane protein HdeD (DUF308 family)